MLTHDTPVRVRYADTDQMGFVYYGNYATFFEIARVEALRHLGLRYRDLEADGVLMPVLENYSKYIRPARYDDLLTVRLMLKELPTTRIRFDYEIYNEAQTLLHIGYTTLVFLERATNRPCHAPPVLMEKLTPHFSANP